MDALDLLQQRITELVPYLPDNNGDGKLHSMKHLIAEMMSLTLDVALEQQNMIQEVVDAQRKSDQIESENEELHRKLETTSKEGPSQDLLEELETSSSILEQLKRGLRHALKANQQLEYRIESQTAATETLKEAWSIKEINLKRIIEGRSNREKEEAMPEISNLQQTHATHEIISDSAAKIIQQLNQSVLEKEATLTHVTHSLHEASKSTLFLSDQLTEAHTESEQLRAQLMELQDENESVKLEIEALREKNLLRPFSLINLEQQPRFSEETISEPAQDVKESVVILNLRHENSVLQEELKSLNSYVSKVIKKQDHKKELSI
ncbi:hypothetical protein HDU98_004440, partial [Podochytrium sp. JEL0797]